jgi:hypothetical protein
MALVVTPTSSFTPSGKNGHFALEEHVHDIVPLITKFVDRTWELPCPSAVDGPTPQGAGPAFQGQSSCVDQPSPLWV